MSALLAGLALVSTGASGRALGVPQGPELERVMTALTTLRSGDREQALKWIVSLKAPNAGVLLDVLTGRQSVDSDTPLIDYAARELLLEAFTSWPDEEAVEATIRWVAEHDGVTERLLGIEALGAIGGEAATQAILNLLRATDAAVLQGRTARVVEQALTEAVRGHPKAFGVLHARLKSLETPLSMHLARAMAGCTDGSALEILDRLTGRNEALDVAVLEVLRAWRSEPGTCSSIVADDIAARLLEASEPTTRRAAAAALGEREAAARVPELVAALSDEDPRVVSTAHWALRRIVGGSLPADPGRWEDWLDTEFEWLSDRSDEVLSLLRADAQGADVGHAVAAMRELSCHRAFRDEFYTSLSDLLRADDPALARAACGAFAALGGRCTGVFLERELDHLAPSVLERAEQILAVRSRG